MNNPTDCFLIAKRKDTMPTKGEIAVMLTLEKINLKFSREKFFDDCRSKRTGNLLFFDFCISSKNSMIEFDGPTHYGKLAETTSTGEYDKIKNEYCQKRGIELLRISYRDYKKIPNIICDFFEVGHMTESESDEILNSVKKRKLNFATEFRTENVAKQNANQIVSAKGNKIKKWYKKERVKRKTKKVNPYKNFTQKKKAGKVKRGGINVAISSDSYMTTKELAAFIEKSNNKLNKYS